MKITINRCIKIVCTIAVEQKYFIVFNSLCPSVKKSSIDVASVAKSAAQLQVCYLAVINPISGCVRIACSGLMMTSLLEFSTGLMQVECQDFLSVSTT